MKKVALLLVIILSVALNFAFLYISALIISSHPTIPIVYDITRIAIFISSLLLPGYITYKFLVWKPLNMITNHESNKIEIYLFYCGMVLVMAFIIDFIGLFTASKYLLLISITIVYICSSVIGWITAEDRHRNRS